MKKLIIILLFSLFLISSCNLNIADKKEKEETYIKDIEVTKLPDKTVYYLDEDIDYKGLIISIIDDKDNHYVINDYTLSHDEYKLGINKININYKEFSTSFDIEIIEPLVPLNNIQDYYQSINLDNNPLYTYYDITYGNGFRQANTLVYYEERNYYRTNPYGYEVAIDEDGIVIDKNTNVELPERGFILSAHGTRVDELKNLNLGDLVIYDDNIFIYRQEFNKDFYHTINLFYYIYSNLDLIPNNRRNSYVTELNQIIDKLDLLMIDYDEELNNECNNSLTELRKEIIEKHSEEHEHKYSRFEHKCQMLEEKECVNYSYRSKYNDTLYHGGFRNDNTLVYYDSSCYRTRNAYGFEVAIDKDGIVIQKEVLVDLPDGGFILSGISSTADFIKQNISIGDKIIIENNEVLIYRDFGNSVRNELVSYRNQIANMINEEIDKYVPHDYEYIFDLLDYIDHKLDSFSLYKGLTYYKLVSSIKKEVNNLLDIILSNLFSNKINTSRGMWYIPLTPTFPDNSYEAVCHTLDEVVAMGYNELIIDVMKASYCIFENSIYETYPNLLNNDYGIYGHDYLRCFIEEAHKRGIIVNAFTQTFAGRFEHTKEDITEYYQKDYDGTNSLGNINYFDICNDNVQDMLIRWYTELLQYDFDIIEYDIIRYPVSTLYRTLDTDTKLSAKDIKDVGYTTYSMNKFMNLYGYSGDLKELILVDKEVRKNWLEFKRNNINNFVKRLSNLIREKSDCLISAAVLNDYPTVVDSYVQDYLLWLNEGYLDFCEPMVYTDSISRFNDIVDSFISRGHIEQLRYGIYTRSKDKTSYTTELLEAKRSLDETGFIFFSSQVYFSYEQFRDYFKKNHHFNIANRLIKEEILIEEYQDIKTMIEDFYLDYYDLIPLLDNGNYNDIINYLNNINDEKVKLYLLDLIK